MSYSADPRDVVLPAGSSRIAFSGISLIRRVGVLVVPTGAAAA
ncbi:MAG TPA: hypothetical protein VKP30_31005 [Polyangiaceae bacterium]|nr:hypothetical protein [Polyangiaceae bacterium]